MTETATVTIAIPGRFVDWFGETGVGSGRDAADMAQPDLALLHEAFRDAEVRKVGKGTQYRLTFTGQAPLVKDGLLALREYGSYCLAANADEPDHTEVSSARYVMQRCEAALLDVFGVDARFLP